ncbi:uncharacterized protein LOC112590135 isoform X2 [Harpegnathos saltator]|uniref:uncharacterized protein LOC112590135 isoform X2 n=1 Tax=Harpegnathos saltator TaxID=610380 RepID=UPI000DBEE89A|nr:uncharacterized protein LOC112590135 isoform X2 [Harpegnathos saltator]
MHVYRVFLGRQRICVLEVPSWKFLTERGPSSIVEDSFPGDREIISGAFETCLVPPVAIPALLSSLSEATIKQYTRPLCFWWHFCRRSKIHLHSLTFSQALEFLAQEALNVSSYSSLSNMRSAISLISHNEIGNHSMVKRFCKNIAAPRSRYDFIWDPAPVLIKLSTIYSYDSPFLSVITKKLVILLAISQISIDDKLILRFSDRIKASASGRSHSFFFFSRFEDHENLCVFRLVQYYLERTRFLRPAGCDTFFISPKKPLKAVTAQTIGHWIRQSLEDCGINNNIISAHSTRHSSTSRAAQKGVFLDLIKRAAGWTGQSRVFANVYNRSIISIEDFSNAALLL